MSISVIGLFQVILINNFLLKRFVCILQLGSKDLLLIMACPMFQNKLFVGQSIWRLLKFKKNSCECPYDLINMNHNMSPNYILF
jgi:hypothetical protein